MCREFTTKVTETLSNIPVTETRNNRTERVWLGVKGRGRVVSKSHSVKDVGVRAKRQAVDRFTHGLNRPEDGVILVAI